MLGVACAAFALFLLACTWLVLWAGAWLLGHIYELLTGGK